MDIKDLLLTHNFNFSEVSRVTGIGRETVSNTFKKLLHENKFTQEELSKSIKYISRDFLVELYCNRNYNISQLLAYFNISNRSSIIKKLKELNIVNQVKEDITKLYKEGLSQDEIAQYLNIPIDRVNFYFKHYSIWREKQVLNTIDINDFKTKYYNHKVPMEDIAKYFKTSTRTLQTFMVRNNLVKRNRSKYLFNYEDLNYYYNNSNYTMDEIATIYNCSRKTVNDAINELGIPKNSTKISSGERRIKEFLDTYNIEYVTHSRSIIPPYELDFYLPKHNIAIEHDGLYYHSVQVHNNPFNIQLKHDLCKQKNIRLISIFADELINKENIVINRLLYLLNLLPKANIHARKCIIKEISSREGIDFLNQTHIQGAGKNNLYLGAFFNNSLVSVMSFKKDKDWWDLNRFAAISSIPGMASKLLTFFERNFSCDKLKTYSDPRWNTGNLYTTLGFTKEKDSAVSYWYVNKECRINRQQFQKHKILASLGLKNSELTEEELVIEVYGLYRIYGCRQMRFTKKYAKST